MSIQYDLLKQYSQTVDSLRFPLDKSNPNVLLYFPENTSLIAEYSKMNLRQLDFKAVIVPTTILPKSKLLQPLVRAYRANNLFSYSSNLHFPTNINLILDMSLYMGTVDNIYKPKNYRMRIGNLLLSVMNEMINIIPDNYRKILVYSIDKTKEIPNLFDRKIFLILQMLKKEDILPFDDLLLCTTDTNKTTYRLLVKNKEYSFPLVLNYIRSIKSVESEIIEKETDISNATDIVINDIKNKKLISDKNKEKYKPIIAHYLSKHPTKAEEIIVNKELENNKGNEKLTKNISSKVAVSSVLFRMNGNIKRSDNIVKNIDDNKMDSTIKAIDNNYIDELLPIEKASNATEDQIIKLFDIPTMVDNKYPSHLFNKRNIDFDINLKKDMTNIFKVLETKEIPIKLRNLEIIDQKPKFSELSYSETSLIKATLEDEFGTIHDVKIEIPKIKKDGTFNLYGQRKCLLNQIVLCPISFPKKYLSKFESSYSVFRIWSRKLKTGNHLEIYIGSYKLPLFILLSYSFGMDNILKLFDLKLEKLQTTKIDKLSFKDNMGNIYKFTNIDSPLKEELARSIIKENIHKYNVKNEFGTKQYFTNLIINMTGKINSTYLIDNTLDNIVDPISKQVLINQNLPIDLLNIMKYMSEKVVDGFMNDRNDLSNQRIRNSEVLVHLANKQILSAYTTYREQVLSGNKEAKLEINQTKVMKDFINSELVTAMEYSNPLEEMATITKITPIGKSIGGIPSKEGIQLEARDVHESYFGNIDPLDTPEGNTIGINQQLTIDAFITTSRGLIKLKPINNNEHAGVLSTSAAMIPFVECNDGARVMFSCNQSRQMLPLKNPEPPFIQTGYESLFTNLLSEYFIKKSPCTGRITKISFDFIEIECSNGDIHRVNIIPASLRSGSGKNSLSIFKPTIYENKIVKKNEIIAEGSGMKNGTISLGRNLLVAVMPYKGYNYEDGIVLSDKLVKEDKLTSLHLVEEEITLQESDLLNYFFDKIGVYLNKGEHLVRKTLGDIFSMIDIEEEEESEEFIAGQYVKKSPGGFVADIEVFSNIEDISKFPQLKKLIIRTNEKYNKPKNEKYRIRGKIIEGILIKYKIQQELPIGLGDKMANRYGAKGIVSCYDSSTEIFTNNGWKLFKDINDNDKVAYIRNDGKAAFIKPLNYIESEYDGIMYGVKTRNLDYLVTPNHRMSVKLVEDKFKGNNEYRIETADQVYGKRRYIKVSSNFKLEERPFDTFGYDKKDFCEFMGWFINEGYADGTETHKKINIYQSKKANPKKYLMIQSLLNRMNILINKDKSETRFVFTHHELYEYLKPLGTSQYKFIPEELFYSGKHCMEILLNSLILGNGSNCYHSFDKYSTTSFQLAQDVTRLANLLGYSTNLNIDNRKDSLPIYNVYIKYNNKESFIRSKNNHYITQYKGKIYCVEVPNNLVYVRRNNKPMWCGNSIVPASEMPRTPWGESVEIIVNPLGIINRMNIGQLYELYTGLIAREIAHKIIGFNGDKNKISELLRATLGYLDTSKNKMYSEEVIKKIYNMKEDFFKLFNKQLLETRVFPIIVPPFKSPNYKLISEVLKRLNLKTTYNLFLPDLQQNTIQKVPVGYMYFAKLEHMGDIKIHARSTGPVTGKYMQPTQGKRREGGQRIGELDSYAILSNGCPILLQEMLSVMSDDQKGKNEMISEILINGQCEFRSPQVSPTKDILAAYFVSLMLGQK